MRIEVAGPQRLCVARGCRHAVLACAFVWRYRLELVQRSVPLPVGRLGRRCCRQADPRRAPVRLSVVVAVTWASGARLAHDEAAAALCAVTDGV